ncbi:restriction endonuclease [Piscinibacter sakaiensis]|uniref:restriction endonuclease n=1 Tax=Piscinibacter sakaiensis TaxID=1547922 RepID=UPI003AB08153
MARRKRTSPGEDLIDLIALLPWWAGLALAFISYVLLHQVASQPLVVGSTPAEVTGSYGRMMWLGLATAGQYLLPVICMLGAGLSAWRRRERQQLVSAATGNDTAKALDGMTWREFEKLVGEGFRLQGYKVMETGGQGPDGGIDLVLARPAQNKSEIFLVQCKQWRAFKVGVDVVRELYGVMAAKGAAGGFVVTSGRFTNEATAFAQGRNVKLIDGPKLEALIKQVKTESQGGNAAPSSTSVAASTPSSADCPICTKPMLQRTAKRGAKAGQMFWGCSDYPVCRGTRAI